ncbi:hypothetical protein EYC59_03530 [Candidatus Saccharibacteria bacterium]|nr:MAG: hypothetical protein EYC59_03530 [Candidatus Saccharibacteria bacterium]
MANFPFKTTKVPVCVGYDSFQRFRQEYPNFTFCPYLADKDEAGWELSTSRVYMNQVLPEFLYVPINIPKSATHDMSKLLERFDADMSIAAINITQPHKSSPLLKEKFLGNEHAKGFVDTLIRSADNRLVPYDLNAPAFVHWYTEEVGALANTTVILNGVGGAGEALAFRIASQNPAVILLVDPTPKAAVAESLKDSWGGEVVYYASIESVPLFGLRNVVLINAAGKEGAADDSGILKVLKSLCGTASTFVDIRPQNTLSIVEEARRLGWKAHTGSGMNARNDYELLLGIAEFMQLVPPSFSAFEALVYKAS